MAIEKEHSNLIGISGKKTSGKDTVGKIIQILMQSPHFNTNGVVSFLKRQVFPPSFEIKKFADTLKDMMCLLIGCTREQLEDEEFKNTILSEEWWYYKTIGLSNTYKLTSYLDNNITKEDLPIYNERYLIKPTPRLLMQQLGTECGRDILHPNLWVISLMSKYKKDSNWIITDMRFPNEVEAVFQKQGLLLRIESKRCNLEDIHPSETALDNFKGFDEVIINDGTIEELIEKVRKILIKYKYL